MDTQSKLNLLIALLVVVATLIPTNFYGQAREKQGSSRPSATPNTSASKGFQTDKLVLGGNFGAQFGNLTLIEASPTIGYEITERLISGVGARYIYFRERGFRPSNTYGGAIYSQFIVIEEALIHAELEYLSIEDFANPNNRFEIISPLVGAGYRSAISANSFVNFLVLFDLNGDTNSPYRNPIVRINFAFGL